MLPLAMLVLLVLSAVLIGLSLVTGQEPLVAANHLRIAQAQAAAEAGLDRALWALNAPSSPDGVAWAAPAPAPYDASRLITVVTDGVPYGAFRIAIAGGGDRQRQVHATGLVPASGGPLGQARHEVSATAIRLRFPAPPAGLTVRGDLTIGPGVAIDAAGDGSCGDLAGTWTSGVTAPGTGSQVLGRGAGSLQIQPPQIFDDRAFDPAELVALRAVAQARGTYYRGPLTFDSSRPIPDGLIFIDAPGTGPAESPQADLVTASIDSGATGGPEGAFRGWLVVNGSLSISGHVTLQGLAFATNRFRQTGEARLIGAAMAGHVGDGGPSLLDARPATGPALVWSCETARTGGHLIPDGWMVKPGSYREAAG